LHAARAEFWMPFTLMREQAHESPGSTLSGRGVIVTRPLKQCDALLGMLQARGAHARCLPVVEIEAPSDPAPAIRALNALENFDIAIFVSANAVRKAMELKTNGRAFPDALAVAAVGPATRNALEQAGVRVEIEPSGEYSSEGLLRSPALTADAVRDKRVLLVKGEGGRSLLGDTLTQDGAYLTRIDVYRRSRPRGSIHALLGEPLNGFEFIVLTSGTALDHLLELASPEERAHVLNTPLVVVSTRLADIAVERGARHEPIVAAKPADAAIVDALERWLARASPETG
jgi:uroporphyrinogen-III synthase